MKTANIIPMQLPSAGMNVRDDLAEMEPQFSPWLLNVLPTNQKLTCRKGYVSQYRIIQTTIPGVPEGQPDIVIPATAWRFVALGVQKSAAGASRLWAYQIYVGETLPGGATAFPSIRDVTDGYPAATTYALLGDNSLRAWSTHFKKRLAFIIDSSSSGDESAIFDGTNWSLWGFTYSATPVYGRTLVSFKGRVYIFNGTDCYWSSTVGAITGATNKTDFAEVFESNSDVVWGSVITSPGERPAETYLAFGNADGEILVYSGAYPDSASWSIAGRYKTAAPIGYNSIVQWQGDTWILTKTGVVSLNQLLSQGGKAAGELRVSRNIDPYWQSLVRNMTSSWNYSASGAYWEEEDKIYILLPGHIDSAGAYSSAKATMFVYNCLTQAWAIQSLSTVATAPYTCGVTYFQDAIYFCSGHTIMKIGTGYKDEAYNTAASYSAIPYEVDTAYTNFGSNGVKRVQGFQPVMKTDFAKASVTVKAASDFGRKVSAASSVALVDGYNDSFYSVGVDGTYVQARILGNSDVASTDGLEIYSLGVSVE